MTATTSRSSSRCFWLIMAACFLGGLLGGLWMTADAQAPVPHSYDELHQLRGEAKALAADSAYSQYHGAVGCDQRENVPVIQHITPPGDSLLRAETVRHEATHFVQLARTGCQQTIALWQSSPLAWLLAEAQATCTGFEVYGADRAKRHARMIQSILVVAFRRPPGISMGDVWAAFRQACGEPATDSAYVRHGATLNNGTVDSLGRVESRDSAQWLDGHLSRP